MHKCFTTLLTFSLVVLLLAGACASPTIPVTPTPEVSPIVTRQLPSHTSSDEEVVWQKVIEAARKEGTVTVYTSSFSGDVANAMADAFHKKYGIRAELIAGPGAGMAERISTELRTKTVVADVGEISASYGLLMLKAGQLIKLGKELPVLREDVWQTAPNLDEDGYILLHSLIFMTPWVNTNLVKQDQEPRSWTDLVNSKWKDQIISYDPRTTAIPDQAVYLLPKYKLVETDFPQKLVAQRLIFPSGIGLSPPFMALARGDAAIFAFGYDSTGTPVALAGGPIKPLLPQPGILAAGNAVQLINAAPHLNAGKLFINFLLSKEGQELETRMKHVGGLRKDLPDRSIFGGKTMPKIFTMTPNDLEQPGINFTNRIAAKTFGVQ